MGVWHATLHCVISELSQKYGILSIAVSLGDFSEFFLRSSFLDIFIPIDAVFHGLSENWKIFVGLSSFVTLEHQCR